MAVKYALFADRSGGPVTSGVVTDGKEVSLVGNIDLSQLSIVEAQVLRDALENNDILSIFLAAGSRKKNVSMNRAVSEDASLEDTVAYVQETIKTYAV